MSQPRTPTSHDPKAQETAPHADATVYLVQEPTIPKSSTGRVIDTSALLWWGKVRVLMERTLTASFRPGQAATLIDARLDGFKPDRDYIAVAGGDSLAVILVGATLARHGHPYFNYLRFERTRLPDGSRDSSSGGYVPIRVPLIPEPLGS
jgi:hypothetical protein